MKALIGAIVIILMFITPAWAEKTPGSEANRILNHISNAIITGKVRKPITRSVIAPQTQSPDLKFTRQSDLTNDLVDRYLERSISHFLPWGNPTRSREFLQNTGTKFIHWSHLLWGAAPPDWKILSAEIDAVHKSNWGSDVVFEAGVMEAIYKNTINSTPIPDWLYQCMTDLGMNAGSGPIVINQPNTRKPGPNGAKFFSYENMFDRKASDWPADNIGAWSRDKNGMDDGSVPDITLPETQLWYAYLITEYIDAGFEGIMFGQIDRTGRRDKENKCIYEMTEFAKRIAAARGYRRSVFSSSHHYYVAHESKPIFTHMSWPSRMFYSNKYGHGMECGLYASEDGQHRTAAEFHMMVKKPPVDLPFLIEIDNYGPMPPTSPIACNSDGDDEITAYMKKPRSSREAFLRHYYAEFQTYTNKQGKQGRFHLAPSGERCGYMPYKEKGGEENLIKELFAQAAANKKPAEDILPIRLTNTTKPIPDIQYKTYTNKEQNFSILYPAAAQIADKSTEMKSEDPKAFWIMFTVNTNNKPVCTVNVRHITLPNNKDLQSYAEANSYLLSWENYTANGLKGFKTTTGSVTAKKVTHRAVLVDGQSIWMLNLTDTSGGAPENTNTIFERMVQSLNVKGLEPIAR